MGYCLCHVISKREPGEVTKFSGYQLEPRNENTRYALGWRAFAHSENKIEGEKSCGGVPWDPEQACRKAHLSGKPSFSTLVGYLNHVVVLCCLEDN